MEYSKEAVLRGKYDVAVCGGGIAGISAALEASRMGKKTLLIEKQFVLGGLATAGLVTVFLPLCDGCGRQVSFGIADELLRLSITHGAEDEYPENWLDGIGARDELSKRFKVRYNAGVFAILAERLLKNTGVDILYGTSITDISIENDKVKYIFTENKSGLEAYEAVSVVDATGDCDIAHLAGVPTKTFNQGNILAAWYYSLQDSKYCLNPIGFCDIPDEDKNDNNKVELLNNRRFAGLDGHEISEFVCMSHDAIYNDFLKKSKNAKTNIITSIPTIPQLRMTRRIDGEYIITSNDDHKYFEDSVGMVSHWRKRGPIYEVPFRSLYSQKIKNLIFAGRCVSSDETMWDVLRVIPCCAVTGQAAGTAAALTDDIPALNVSVLQGYLKDNNVKLHISEIL